MRLAGTKLAANHQYRGFGDQLYDLSGQRPSLDLNFSSTKSLVDATTGQNLVTFTRASSGTYVDSQGVIRTATTNEARFDHSPTTGESLGLLVEESRTNLLLRSEEFDNASWSPTGLASVAANSTAAPDGTTTADVFIETSGVSETHRALQTVSVTSGVSYAASVFAKQDQRRYCYLIFSPNATWNSVNTIAYFDLQTGVVVSAANCTATITAFPDGWYRCTATATATATNAAASVGVGASANGTAQTYTGNGSNAIAVWGAQLEAGAFPTSYIPTTTAAVTRSADVASISGSNFSSWYRQDEGTVFASATTNARHGGVNSFPRIASLSGGTTQNRIDLLYRVLTNYTDAGYSIVSSNVSQATFDTNDERNGQSMATAYATNNFAFAVGGSLANTDTSGTVPTVDRLSIGLRSGIDLPMNGTIKRLTYFPIRLANSTLQQITQ